MTTTTTEMLPAAPEAPESGSNKKVLLAGALAAAVALGGAGYFLLLSGGEDTADQSLGTPVTRTTTKVATPRKAPVKKPAVKPANVPAVSKVPLGRDPFRALYLLPAVGPGAGTSSPTTTAPTVSSPSTSGGGTTTPSTTNDTPTTTTAPKSYALTLKRVYGSGSQRTAEFVVGGKTMLAKVGSVFGPTSELKLLSLGQSAKGAWVATLQVGDDEPFDAALGERLYVK